MIYVTGDMHGEVDWAKIFKFKERTYTTLDDVLIIAGDFGGVFDGSQKVLDRLAKLKLTIAFVDGNHENFDLLETYPYEELYGGKVQRLRPNIVHLLRGEIYTIEGKTIFTFGGGTSIDKEWRLAKEAEVNSKRSRFSVNHKPYKIWWKQEQPTQEEIQYALSNLAKHGNKVDYIITHTGFMTLMYSYFETIKEHTELNDMLEFIYKNIDYSMWYCGHFHIDSFCKEVKTRILYQDIVRIGEGLNGSTERVNRVKRVF